MNKSENTKNKNDSKENRKEDSQELHFEGGEIDFTQEFITKILFYFVKIWDIVKHH